MELKTYFAQDASGNIIPNAQVFVYLAGTTTLASGIVDQNGAPLTNPFNADSSAAVVFAAPDGEYDVKCSGASRTVTIRAQLFDGGAFKATLAATGGSALVGYDGGTVQMVLDDAKPLANYAALRAYTGRATGVRITKSGIAGFFQRDDADTASADNGGTIIVDDAGRRWNRLFASSVSVSWFGAIGDGVKDDSLAVVSAIGACAAAGGGRVYFPPGTYLVRRTSGTISLEIPSNVILMGAGRGVSIIKNNDNAHVINFNGVSNVGVVSLTIDGDYTNTTSQVHGIRSAGVDGLILRDLGIKNCKGYGLGMQAGSQRRVQAQNIWIETCGMDGIDIKDPNLNNAQIQFNNVFIRNPGVDYIALGLPQAGMSWRGEMQATNIYVWDIIGTNAGIRADQSTPAAADTQGGWKSQITNFSIKYAETVDGSVGLDIRADSVQAQSGYISGADRGVEISDSAVRVSGVVSEGCKKGFCVTDDTRQPIDVAIDGCVSRRANATAGTVGFEIAAGTITAPIITRCRSRNAETGCVIGAGVVNATIRDCNFDSNTTAITDGGTKTIIQNVRGYKTFGVYQSESLVGDSAGSKTFSITHGLGRKPTIEEIAPFFIRETNVTDIGVRSIAITAVGETTFAGTAFVSTASATTGAKFKIGFHVELDRQ